MFLVGVNLYNVFDFNVFIVFVLVCRNMFFYGRVFIIEVLWLYVIIYDRIC